METRDLFHGANGDNILAILRQGQLRPNRDGRIFFSERRFDAVLMHGGDLKRKATFAIKVRVQIPTGASVTRGATAGVADTLIVTSSAPLRAEILELYVREPRAASIKTIKGKSEMIKFLEHPAQ